VTLALRAAESCHLLLLNVCYVNEHLRVGQLVNLGFFFLIRCVIVRSAEECKLDAACRGSLHNSDSKKLLQIIKHNFMTALLNFIGGSTSKLYLTTGHSQWHLVWRRIDGHNFSLDLVRGGKEIVFLCYTVFIMGARYFIAIKSLWSIFMLQLSFGFWVDKYS